MHSLKPSTESKGRFALKKSHSPTSSCTIASQLDFSFHHLEFAKEPTLAVVTLHMKNTCIELGSIACPGPKGQATFCSHHNKVQTRQTQNPNETKIHTNKLNQK